MSHVPAAVEVIFIKRYAKCSKGNLQLSLGAKAPESTMCEK